MCCPEFSENYLKPFIFVFKWSCMYYTYFYDEIEIICIFSIISFCNLFILSSTLDKLLFFIACILSATTLLSLLVSIEIKSKVDRGITTILFK